MKKLTKEQQVLLEKAIAKLNTFLKEKYNVEYDNAILCLVYEDLVRITQCSTQEYIAWEVNIWLEERRIYIVTRKVEGDSVCPECDYTLLYMGSVPTTFTLDF